MTPKRMVAVAASIVAVTMVLDVAGGRAATAALSGSIRGGGLVFGAIYMSFYFAAVLVAPPLVITAGALAAIGVLRTGTKDAARLR